MNKNEVQVLYTGRFNEADGEFTVEINITFVYPQQSGRACAFCACSYVFSHVFCTGLVLDQGTFVLSSKESLPL